MTHAEEGIATANVELNGINVISEDERKGSPRDLFWPWFAGNIGVLGLSYGAFLLGFNISFWQAAVGGIVGIVLSFLLVGFVAVAGKRGSAPTMVLSRAAFGVRNKIPAILSWILCVGWETVIAALAVEATATVFGRLHWGSGVFVKIVALLVVVALIILGGVMGFDVLMKIQGIITVVTGILTIGFILLTAPQIHWSTVLGLKAGHFEDVLGGLILVFSGFGLGWVNMGADYSRYLPRKVSSGAVVGWTTFGASIGPVVLLIFGLLLAGSSSSLSSAVSANPIGALAALLPTWFLIPFVVVAVLGLVGAADMDIYSSGLALLSAGLRVPRYVASGIDGVIMVLGTIYIVFFSPENFLGPFEGFLISIGVPIAAWCGVMLADIAIRRQPYSDEDLYQPSGIYGGVNPLATLLVVLGTFLGWGTVVNTSASWLSWQGYLLGPLGLGGKTGVWAYANLGVILALLLTFFGWVIFGRGIVRRQEAAQRAAGSGAARRRPEAGSPHV
ncbi:MAG: cytosine permease [Alicyclobacillus sp.]|nr:cytosine permease [Alicyclobacillus sp.]